MRLVILKDIAISSVQFNKLRNQFTDLYHTHTGITPTFFVEDFEYKNIPTIIDNDGDVMPSLDWRKDTIAQVHKRYGDFGTDHVVLLVHRNNWVFKGIWGTNWSNVYHGYHVQLCRFDDKNAANALGTLYHEVHHSHDALIKATLGIDVNPIVEVSSWDRAITHGGQAPWKYIRWKENTDSLRAIAPLLKQSYDKRKQLHDDVVKSLLKQVVSLAERYLILLRQRRAVKNGVPR